MSFCPSTAARESPPSPASGQNPGLFLTVGGLLGFAIISSPVALWYVRRVTDGSDEPLGLLALSVAFIFLWQRRAGVTLRPGVLWGGSALLGMAQWAGLDRAPLLLGALAILLLSASLRMQSGGSGFLALLGLSLPITASLDFYSGYPLRLATAEMTTWLLSLTGVVVERTGVLLLDGDKLVGVDPPCAGVRMLWTAVFVAAVLAAKACLKRVRTLLLLTLAPVFALGGNALRSAALFFPESGRVEWPHWMHEGIGLTIHGVVLALLLVVCGWLAKRRSGGNKAGRAHDQRTAMVETEPETPARAQSPAEGQTRACINQRPRGVIQRMAWVAALCLSLFIAGLWAAPGAPGSGVLSGVTACLTSTQPPPQVARDDPMAWPATFQGVPLRPLPLTAKEAQFAKSFPGSLARFQCGDAEIIMRRVTAATRKLHSSADCLRASGYAIKHRPVRADADGDLWGRFEARSAQGKYEVTERITSAHTRKSFTDVSAWYWHAVWHGDDGPWLAVTVMREVE